MEKFNDWRDKGTGIHPFLYPKGLPKPLLNKVTGYFLGFVKAILLIILTLFWFILHSLSNIFILSVLVDGVQFVWSWLLGRPILFLLGFLTISVKRTKKQSKKELYVCNHSSYLDILILQVIYRPTFLAVSKEGVEPKSFWAMFGAMNVSHPISLKEYLKNGPKRVVVFPEATTSNGKAILEFQSIFNEEVFDLVDIYAVAIRYHFKYFCPCYTTGSIASHLWNVCCQFKNNVQLIESKRIESSKNPNQDLQKQLSVVSGLPMVRLSLQDKISFLQTFNKKSR